MKGFKTGIGLKAFFYLSSLRLFSKNFCNFVSTKQHYSETVFTTMVCFLNFYIQSKDLFVKDNNLKERHFMKRNNVMCTLATVAALWFFGGVVAAQDTTDLKLFNAVTFYDGYRLKDNPDSLVNDGVLRHTTSLYAVKMTDEQLNEIGDSLKLSVSVQACCDNYDRIGNINLAFVPKGQAKYDPYTTQRIEIGRFITPFMDKNKKPDTVPYTYNVGYLSYIFRDRELRSKYDIWCEFELFGVPYAANEQIAGCAGRSDVFKGTLDIITSKPALPETDDDVLVPIVMKKPEYLAGNLNNYDSTATDTIGKTVKTYTFEVPRDVEDGQIVLVTSNHGANAGGEEYNRRWHYVYVDDKLMLTYKPGRKTCEPFRKYNTQANGIYGYLPKTDYAWQSFSNWCPGDVIDNRIIPLGAVKAGKHKVRISVPEAQFVGGQGFIPVSMFFQGLTQGSLSAIDDVPVFTPESKVKITADKIIVSPAEPVSSIEVYDLQGHCLLREYGKAEVNRPACPQGLYLINVELADGLVETHKVVLK